MAVRKKGRPPAPSVQSQHAEWIGLLRPDGPFIAVSVLAKVFAQGLDLVPDKTYRRLRQAWDEVQEAPDLRNPAWQEFVLDELLRLRLTEGSALPDDLRSWGTDSGVRPDATAFGPSPDGLAERLLVYRLPWDTSLTTASKRNPSPVEQAADLCRRREVPLALLTNGRLWALVHARTGEPTTVAVFDADLWLEERELLRAFVSLLGANHVVALPRTPDGAHSGSLAALFARSAEASAEVTDTLGLQVRQAVELLVGELSRLDRESSGELLSGVAPREAYKAALSVMMRLVFLLYAEEQRLMPVDSELYASSYSVAGLYDQLANDQMLHGDEVGDRRAAAWPRLLALFGSVYGGSEHDELRIPPYGGTLFDPGRFPWLAAMKVTDRVIHEILDALAMLRITRTGSPRPGGPERLSYKGLDVEQIGHVYEGLLEYSCLRISEPYVGLIGKLEPELPLSELEAAFASESDFAGWLSVRCMATSSQVSKALTFTPSADDLAMLDTACDNDHELSSRARPLLGLLRRDLRSYPTVFPSRSLIIMQVGDRRATGTHYTPRALAEEVVKHTLAPLCYSPGPADGVEESAWRARTAEELLRLKVLDPAMGSGAFLVSACRYLAERVVEAWARDGMPFDVSDAVGPLADRDDLMLEACRRVAARCIYGVDRDEQAVELAKLSLWLVTLSKEKPFSFLDHALRCGDSLVGLLSEDQVEAFHLDPARGRALNARLSGTIDELTGPLLTRVQVLREQIESEPIRDPVHGAELAAKLAEAERLSERLRLASDAVVAAALSTAGKSEDLYDERLASLAGDLQEALAVDESGDPTFEAQQAEKSIRELITPMLQGPRVEPIRPLHWALEFPEVMRRDGFNAVVGNPPFIGGKRVSGALGTDVREYLKDVIAGGRPGNADLCAYFLLRDLSLAPHGRTGLITTNTIAQGDTREVGLDQVEERHRCVYRAEKSQPWPGTASLEVSLVWIGPAVGSERRYLAGEAVPAITSSLDPASRVKGAPHRLAANSGQAFVGCYVLGMGFLLEPHEARGLIEKDPRNQDVLYPYLNGEDLNSRRDGSASRWVIDFNNWPIERAMGYSDVFAIVESRVKPERQRTKPDGSYVLRKPLPHRWWQYADKRPALRNAIADLDRVLAIALVSKTGLPMWQRTGQVFSHMLGVFATDRSADLALLSSSMHFVWWTVKGESTMRTDARYTPSDGFETFPMPAQTEAMTRAGDFLEEYRHSLMEDRRLGLTALYNFCHGEGCDDGEILKLRRAHIDVDEAVRDAYASDEESEPAIREFEAGISSEKLPAWRDIDLGHGFHKTPQGTRFTISQQAQSDVLDKLLALNHYRHKQEVEQGLHNRKGKAKGRVSRPAPPEHPEESTLFSSEETLF